MEQLNYMVCVSCMTYNHAPYITDALNGFCIQKTTFPFVCTIVDDASTDGEQEVIKKFLQEHFDLEEKAIVRNEETDDYILTFARHKTNKNCFFAVLYLKYNHYRKKSKMPYVSGWRENSKYIAYCEGDDYWIAADKLQQQVSFLEKHDNFSMVFSKAEIVDENKNNIGFRTGYDSEISQKLFTIDNFIPTLTACIRTDKYKEYRKISQSSASFCMGDLPLWLYLSNVGEVKYIDYVTSSYRELRSSASHTTNYEYINNFYLSSITIRSKMNEILNLNYKESLFVEIYYRKMISWCFSNRNAKLLIFIVRYFYFSPLHCIKHLHNVFIKRLNHSENL